MQSGPRCKNIEENKKKGPAEISPISLGFLNSVDGLAAVFVICYISYCSSKDIMLWSQTTGMTAVGKYIEKKSESVARTHHNEN